MQQSLPSREVHSVNMPEPKNVASDFRYNFFMPTEGAQELDETSQKFLKKVPEVYPTDGSLDTVTGSVSRFVRVSWTMPAARTASVDPGFIRDNASKVVTEADFSTNNFFSVLFADPLMNKRLYGLATGSIKLQKGATREGASGRELSAALRSAVPESSFDIVTAGLNQIRERFGMSFFDAEGVEVVDSRWKGMNEVSTVVQLNSVLSHGIIEHAMEDPHSPYKDELRPLLSMAARLAVDAKKNNVAGLSDYDFRTYVPYVDVTGGDVSLTSTSSEIVGYIVDKVEYTADGGVKNHPSAYIENHAVRSYIDVSVKYGASYGYSVRAVARVRTAAIDDRSHDVALITFLVSSRPSNKVISRCIELVAPPVPNDVHFVWNYETDRLYINWSFPPNSQRDIKEYQVFRRSSTKEPFQLLRVYRFNDAVVQDRLTVHASELGIDRRSVTYSKSPVLHHVDDEFTKASSYIYTVASVDAHGLTSNYGAQYRVGFDAFRNRLTLEHVSHSGAPRPYPNMYLNVDLFVDTVKVSGPSSKRLKVYLTPELYTMVDDGGQRTEALVTRQDGGSYVFQWINTDNQKLSRFEVVLDDRRTKK
jgi:hypothetical protein